MRAAKRHHSAWVSGIKLHWISLGKKSALPTVVMLHGLNDCALTWLTIGEELARDRQVLIPDLPGHGQSDRPNASYQLSWYAEVMSEWMRQQNIRNADLIGHSFGGGVAQVMLLSCRERVRRLVLVSSGGLGKEVNFALRLASLPFLIENLGQPLMKIGTQIALRLARDGRSGQDINVLSRFNARQGSARVFSRTVRDVINLRGQRRGYHERLHEVRDLPPILVLWGAKDPIIPAAHALGFTLSVNRARMIVLEHSGHYPHYQETALFTQHLRDFLATPHPLKMKRAIGL